MPWSTYARLFAWRCAHFRSVRIQRHDETVRYATPVSADGAGWPDLVLVHDHRILFRELKSDRGVLSVEQQDWLHALERAGADVDVWRPKDWTDGTIEVALRGETI